MPGYFSILTNPVMKKTFPTLLLLCMGLITGCAMNRTVQTDNLGWTDPEPPGGPALEDHRPRGAYAYQPGMSNVTQPSWPRGAPDLQSNNPYQVVPPQPSGY
jgi:hypothetical protein